MTMRTLAAVAAIGLLAAAPPAPERVISGDRVVAARIGGAAGRMLVDPGGTAMPLIDAGFAQRAGLRGGMFGVSYAVGPEVIAGDSAVARIDLGSGEAKRRVGWAARRASAGVDGVVGPGGLPEPVVRFVLRAPIAGERVVALPMVTRGGLAGRWGELFAQVAVGGQPIKIHFDLRRAATLATAGAGLRLSEAHGGRLHGPVGRAEIIFGVERPVRAMALATPLAVGPLAIGALGVRTADFGDGSLIRSEDDDEVIVVGGKRDIRRDRISIGRDDLARCSSIVFDKRAKRIRLTCA